MSHEEMRLHMNKRGRETSPVRRNGNTIEAKLLHIAEKAILILCEC